MTDRFYKILGMWTLAFMVFLILPIIVFMPEAKVSGHKVFFVEACFSVLAFYYDKFVPEGSFKW